jgi:hypothetical protein
LVEGDCPEEGCLEEGCPLIVEQHWLLFPRVIHVTHIR